MRISDWSSGVCSSDLIGVRPGRRADDVEGVVDVRHPMAQRIVHRVLQRLRSRNDRDHLRAQQLHAEDVGLLPLHVLRAHEDLAFHAEQRGDGRGRDARSEEHTSELQSLMRISYAVFCLKKKNKKHTMYKLVKTHN